MVVSHDLQGLGETDGPPVTVAWASPNLFPRLIPWLIVLVLLTLRPNRTAAAWLILLPLLVLAGLSTSVRQVFAFMPAEIADLVAGMLVSMSFGLAAVWLLADVLCHCNRFLAFLKMLGAIVCVSAVACLLPAVWDEPIQGVAQLMFTGFLALVVTGALTLAGWLSKRRYRPVALTVWTIFWCFVLWACVSSPFFIVDAVSSGGFDWTEFLQGVAMAAGPTVVLVLPFLLLAFVTPFYRGRLKALLGLHSFPPPPVLETPTTGAPAPA